MSEVVEVKIKRLLPAATAAWRRLNVPVTFVSMKSCVG